MRSITPTNRNESEFSFDNGGFSPFLYDLSLYKGNIVGRANGVHTDIIYILDVEDKSTRILYETLEDILSFEDMFVIDDEIYLIGLDNQFVPNTLCKYDPEKDSLEVVYKHSGEIRGLTYHEGWIYFAGVSDEIIYRLNLESASVETVLEISGEHLGILYFSDNDLFYSTTTGVYKYSQVTSECKMILEKVSDAVIVIGDNIFFTDSEADCKLFYYNKSEDTITQVGDDNVREIAIIGDWIYCMAFDSDMEMYTF